MTTGDIIFLNQTVEKCLNLIDNQKNVLSKYEYSICKDSLDKLKQDVEHCILIDKSKDIKSQKALFLFLVIKGSVAQYNKKAITST